MYPKAEHKTQDTTKPINMATKRMTEKGKEKEKGKGKGKEKEKGEETAKEKKKGKEKVMGTAVDVTVARMGFVIETGFEEIANAVRRANLHPKLESVFAQFPSRLSEFGNLLFYGPSGVGKYSQVLRVLQPHSPSKLKYQKKITVAHDKQEYFLNMSDIHVEIDMSMLGCNAKCLWHDIYMQMLEVWPTSSGVLVCKNFQSINTELLDVFYSYMQHNERRRLHLKFVLLSDALSFIPTSVLNVCQVIPVSRPSKTKYQSVLSSVAKKRWPTTLLVEDVSNIHFVQLGLGQTTNGLERMHSHKTTCDRILHEMVGLSRLKIGRFRELLYDVLVYNLNVHTCICYILTQLMKTRWLCVDGGVATVATVVDEKMKMKMSRVWKNTYLFFRQYNNNCRPIYHLERYLFYLITEIHGYHNRTA